MRNEDEEHAFGGLPNGSSFIVLLHYDAILFKHSSIFDKSVLLTVLLEGNKKAN